jgi:hypothetical protein
VPGLWRALTSFDPPAGAVSLRGLYETLYAALGVSVLWGALDNSTNV